MAPAPKKNPVLPKPPAPPAAKPVAPAPKAPTPPAAPAAKPTSAPAAAPRKNTTTPAANPVVKGPSGAPAKPAQYQRYTDPSGAKFQFVSGSWKQTAGAPSAGGAGGAGAADTSVGTSVEDGGAAPASTKTADEIAADIRKSAESAVAMKDPALAGQWTSGTKGLGGLGFGYTKAGGETATYNDIFGSLASGGSVDRSKFEVRDALGRVINKDILGTDVYGGAAATDIAGTALGNEILSARRAAARGAEERSAGGMMGGGLRDAAGEFQNQAEGAAITGLLGKLYGLEGDITSDRTKAYQGALETAAGGDVGRWAPEPTTPSATTPSGTTPTTPTAGKTTLTTGPKGTFMKQVDIARASGTPAQKIQKLTALLGDPKYNMSDLQKKTIKQMITDIQKKK